MKQLNRNVYRVLIVEPDAQVRQQLARALSDAYDVQEAGDADTALALLHDEAALPDAVITDLDLDGPNGLHLMVAAHSIDPFLPVLVVTPPQRLDSALEALRLGARDCIVKPLDSVELLRYSVERAIEDRALPEEKERLRGELRDTTRVKDRLLKLVTEDFQQMLDEFADYARALESDAPERDRLLERARHTAHWMTLRTEQVAIYGELEKFPPKMHPARLPLEGSIRAAIEKVPYDPAVHAIQVEAPMPRVVADPLRLVQVFENLVCSAVQYSPDGGTIHISARDLGETVDVTIVDAGRPIPEPLLAHVFEPFARQNRPRVAGVHSTGLGLCIARTLATLQGGSVSVENTFAGVAWHCTLIAARP